MRQEVPQTAGRTDSVKKNAKTLEVSHKMCLGSLAQIWGHLRQEVPQTAERSQNGQIPDICAARAPNRQGVKKIRVSFCAARAPNRQGVRKYGGPFAPPARRTGKVLENTGVLLRRPRAEQARCSKIRGSFCAARAPNRQGVRKYRGRFSAARAHKGVKKFNRGDLKKCK